MAESLETIINTIRRGSRFIAVPIGVRFTAPSPHYLSPAYGWATAFIEIALVLSTSSLNGQRLDRGGMRDQIAKPALAEIERALCYEGERLGRLHLGKQQNVDHGLMGQLFPQFDAWLRTYQRFNSFGTFNNSFTDQLGLSVGG